MRPPGARRELKRRFAERIVEMADEMAQKRPKSCIAPAATQVLDKWYRDHFAFPYPSDGDKASVLGQKRSAEGSKYDASTAGSKGRRTIHSCRRHWRCAPG